MIASLNTWIQDEWNRLASETNYGRDLGSFQDGEKCMLASLEKKLEELEEKRLYEGGGVTYPSGLCAPKVLLTTCEAARYGTTGIYTAAPLVEVKATDPLSKYFSAGEFLPRGAQYTSPNRSLLRISPELIRRLEEIRKALGDTKITIHSAYRPPEYNRGVGGVSNSTHIDGLAADISAAGISTEALHRVCEVIIGHDGGLGYYPSQQFCHIDVRGYRSRWLG